MDYFVNLSIVKLLPLFVTYKIDTLLPQVDVIYYCSLEESHQVLR